MRFGAGDWRRRSQGGTKAKLGAAQARLGLEAEPRQGIAVGVEPSPEGLSAGRAVGGAGLRLGAGRLELRCPTAGAGGSRSLRMEIQCTSGAEQEPVLLVGRAERRRRVFVTC